MAIKAPDNSLDLPPEQVQQPPEETPAPAGVSASEALDIDSWMDQPFGSTEEDQVLVAGLGSFGRVFRAARGIVGANRRDAVPENLRIKKPGPKTEDDYFIQVDVKEANKPIKVEGEVLRDQQARVDKIDELDSVIEYADYQDFDTSKSWQINPQNFTSAEDFEKAQMAIAKRYRDEIDTQRRGVVTEQEQLKLARTLSNDSEFVNKFITQGPGSALTAEELKAARFLIVKSAENLKQSAVKWRRQSTGDDTTVAELEFLRNWNLHKELLVKWMGARAEAGRSLRAISGQTVGDLKDKSREHLNELIAAYGSGLDTTRLADNIIATNDLIGLNSTVAAQKSGISKFGAAMSENMTGSILSGFSTFAVNLFGNALMIGRNAANLAVASRVGKWTKGDASVVEKGEAMAYLVGMFSSFDRARQAFMVSLRTGEPYGGTAKFEGAKQKAISASAFGLDPNSIGGAALNVYGHIARAPMERILGPTDALFKVINESGQWGQLAYRQAAKDARTEGLSDQEMVARMAQYMADPSNETLMRMKEFGEYQTFTNPLGDFGLSIQRLIERLTVSGIPVGRLLVPVFRTPAQIAKVGFLEDTPLGFASSQMRKDLFPEPEAGKTELTQAQIERQQMAQSRMIVGMMTLGTVGFLAANGSLTGSGPQERGSRDATREIRPARSFVVARDEFGNPTKWASFDRMEPFSLQIGLVADFFEIVQAAEHMDLDESQLENLTDLGSALMISVYENTINKTYMRGINEAISAMQEPARYLDRWQASFINAQLPLSGLRRDIRKMTDPMMREAETLMERLKNSMPYFSKTLPEITDIHGEYVPYDHLMNLPLKTLEVSQEATYQEYNRLFEATRIAPVVKAKPVIGGYKLNSQQKHDYQVIARNGIKLQLNDQFQVVSASLPSYDPDAPWRERIKPQGEGVTFAGAVEAMMLSDAYNDPRITDYVRVEMIQGLQRKFDQAAREFMKIANPEVSEAMQLMKQNDLRRSVGRKSADQFLREQGVTPITPRSDQPMFRN